MGVICKDCLYYLPWDVFKGICKKTKNNISPDQPDEKCFEKNMKCKYCSNFSVSTDDDQLGTCMGKDLAYPDMVAQRCKMFNEQN